MPCILIGPCRPKWMRVVDNFYSDKSSDTQSKLRYYCLRQPDKLDRIAKYIYKRLSQDLHRRHDPIRRAGICGIQGVVRKTVGGQLHLDVVHGANMDKIIPSLLLNICERPEVDPEDSQEDPSQEAVFVFKDIARRASYNNIEPVVASILTHFDHHGLWKQPHFPLLIFQYLLESIENSQIAHGLVKQLVAHLSSHEKNFTLPERTCMVQVIGLTVITLARGAIGPDVFHNFKALLQILRASIDKTPTVPESIDDSTPVNPINQEREFQDAIINTIAEFAKNLPDTQKIEILKFILNFEPLGRYHPQSDCRPRPMSMVLLQTMLTVATQYKTVAISNALNSDFLNILLRGVAVDPDPAIRIIVQKILHTLIDRHGNTERLLPVQTYFDAPLQSLFVWEKPSRQDILFMKSTGVLLTENIYHQLLDLTNKVDSLEHLFCTVGLVALEMGADQVVVELFRLILAVQQKLTNEPPGLPLPHRCALYALLAGAISLLVQLTDLPGLRAHVEEVIQARQADAPYLLPTIAFNRTNTTSTYPSELELRDEWLFSLDRVSEALSSAGFDTSTLTTPYHPIYMSLHGTAHADPLHSIAIDSRNRGSGQHEEDGMGHSMMNRHMIPDPSTVGWGPNRDSSTAHGLTRSESSCSLSESIYSVADSNKATDELLSFKNMHKIVTGSNGGPRKPLDASEEDRLLHSYMSNEFSDIFSHQRDKALNVRVQLAELMDDISVELHHQPNHTTDHPGGVGMAAARKLLLQTSLSDADHPATGRTKPSNVDLDSSSPVGYMQPTVGRKLLDPVASWEREYNSLFLS